MEVGTADHGPLSTFATAGQKERLLLPGDLTEEPWVLLTVLEDIGKHGNI